MAKMQFYFEFKPPSVRVFVSSPFPILNLKSATLNPMGLHLLIDGYNLMGCSRNLFDLGDATLEEAREGLIDGLASYRGLKQAKMTVVFDGGKGGNPTRRLERRKGLGIVYSKIGEEADDVIKEMVREKGKSYVVVTSDNEILQFAESRDQTTIGSQEFRERMEMAMYMSQKGAVVEGEEDYKPGFSTKKKGNPRKLPKKERRKNSILKKI